MSPSDTAFDPVSAALQQLHQSVAAEEVPEDFWRLLDEIDDRIAGVSPLNDGVHDGAPDGAMDGKGR